MKMYSIKKHLFLVVAVVSFLACNSNAQQNVDLPVAQFKSGIEKENIQLLDVRTSEEFTNGHLKDALWADWNNQQQFTERVKALDKSMPVYTYCKSGGRSSAAAKYLRQQGFTVYNLDGGIVSWKKEGMPIEEVAPATQMQWSEYESKISQSPIVLVDFGAEWCPPCKKMNPVIEKLAASPNLKFALQKIDGGDQVELVKRLNVEVLPTFIIYKNGKEFWRKAGIVEANELEAQLK